MAMVPCIAMVSGRASTDGGDVTDYARRFEASCARQSEGTESQTVTTPTVVKQQEPAAVEAVAPSPPPPPAPSAKELLRSWIVAHVPSGAQVSEDGPGFAVQLTTRAGDSLMSVAASSIEATTAYNEEELAAALRKANPSVSAYPKELLAEGTQLRLPSVLALADGAPKSPSEARLGWPADKSMRGIYVNETMLKDKEFPRLLDMVTAHGMNAIVVDAKDVTGWFTYPTKIPLALENDGNRHNVVSSLERLVRVAHRHGVRVVARVACFRDEHLAPSRKDLAVQNKSGGPHRAPNHLIDWLDPTNETVQQYLLDAVKESIDAGADEIQLDYVRYPTEGVLDAEFHLDDRGLTSHGVITQFVGRVHELTKAASVPLSLDVFGCVAWGDRPDVDSTGQDLRALGTEVEALSPMVYPSHFGEGFNGYAIPGDHPDIVAIGTRRALDTLHKAGIDDVVVRPWVQAFPYKSPHFGAPYIAEQIKEGKNGGGIGFLAWNSGGEYGATFAATPLTKDKR